MLSALQKHTTMEWQEWKWWRLEDTTAGGARKRRFVKHKTASKKKEEEKERRWSKVRRWVFQQPSRKCLMLTHITGMLEILTNFFPFRFFRNACAFCVQNLLSLDALAFEHSSGGWENWYHCRFQFSQTYALFFCSDSDELRSHGVFFSSFLYSGQTSNDEANICGKRICTHRVPCLLQTHTAHTWDMTHANWISFCMLRDAA